jgi:adenine specific DNA methylase Mod
MPTLNWIGKDAVVNHHLQVPFHLLKDVPDLACGEPGDGNLIVQGDNLVALKALLPYYAGQVKCIYIDPPYNTGNENWIYNDNVNSRVIREWLGKVVGKEGETLDRHDRWLCMMYPRLALLRQFLREDGIIFVSVDENEYRYLSIMMDELFGAENRLETIVWKKSYGGGSKSNHLVNLHEYIEVFAKRIDVIEKLELPPDNTALKYYKFKDSKFEERGPYRLQPLATTSMDTRPNLRYSIPFEGEEIWPENNGSGHEIEQWWRSRRTS